MKKAEHIREVPFPHDFGSLIAETSRVDLRFVSSGARFVDPEQTDVSKVAGPVLLVVTTPGFLNEALRTLAETREDIWVLLADTDAGQLATMFSQNPGWSVVAQAAVADTLALHIRHGNESDRSLDDVVTGLRLATALAADRPTPATTGAASFSSRVRPLTPLAPVKRGTLLGRIKRRIPRRVKTLVKKALVRR